MDIEELKRVSAINAPGILSKRVDPLGTEFNVAEHELAQMRTLRLADRDIVIPGLARSTGLILQVLADFREKERRNVMPLQYAKSDDIVVMQLRPEHIAADLVWEQDVAIAAGEYTDDFNIIPRVAGTFTIPDKQVFIITDVAELYSPPGITALRVVDVDGAPQYSIETRITEMTDLQIFELPHPIISDASLDLDGKVESKTAGATVTTKATPIGVWIGFGKDVPALFRQ